MVVEEEISCCLCFSHRMSGRSVPESPVPLALSSAVRRGIFGGKAVSLLASPLCPVCGLYFLPSERPWAVEDSENKGNKAPSMRDSNPQGPVMSQLLNHQLFRKDICCRCLLQLLCASAANDPLRSPGLDRVCTDSHTEKAHGKAQELARGVA